MKTREIEAKTLLSLVKQPDRWFGLRYNMNLYRGCQHRCIYCDGLRRSVAAYRPAEVEQLALF